MAWLVDRQLDLNLVLPPFTSFPSARYQNSTPELIDWISHLDQLEHSPIPHHARLGIYFENLVAFFLHAYPKSTLKHLRRNVQVFKSPLEKVTLGELDFLGEYHLEPTGSDKSADHEQNLNEFGADKNNGPMGENTTNKSLANNNIPPVIPSKIPCNQIHLETAVKFYLKTRSPYSAQWLGPNRRDTLSNKLKRLVEHQLPMGQIQLSSQVQPNTELSTNPQVTSRISHYWIKGFLFYHWQEPATQANHPTYGYWLHKKDLQRFSASTTQEWRILERAHCLGGYYDENTPTLDNPDQQQRISKAEKPTMLISPNLTSGGAQRAIIVNDRWPADFC